MSIYFLTVSGPFLPESSSHSNVQYICENSNPLFPLLKMLEIGACMELKAKTVVLEDNADTESVDISFEELLAKEKKDSFWLVSHLNSLSL